MRASHLLQNETFLLFLDQKHAREVCFSQEWRDFCFSPALAMAPAVPDHVPTGAASKHKAADREGDSGPASTALCDAGRSWALSGLSCNECLAFNFV